MAQTKRQIISIAENNATSAFGNVSADGGSCSSSSCGPAAAACNQRINGRRVNSAIVKMLTSSYVLLILAVVEFVKVASSQVISATITTASYPGDAVFELHHNHPVALTCSQAEIDRIGCLNGGHCHVAANAVDDVSNRSIVCRCSPEWIGDQCQFVHIAPLLNAVHTAKIIQSSAVAAACVSILLVAVLTLSIIVYIRYRRKKYLLADREFKATAEELYRRPFNGRSSIVESLSRINSIRRSAEQNGDTNAAQSSTGGEAAQSRDVEKNADGTLVVVEQHHHQQQQQDTNGSGGTTNNTLQLPTPLIP